MKNAEKPINLKHMIYKALLIALIAICLVIGVIGIILPVIPGFLFLFFAAMLAAKLSSRFSKYLGEKNWMKKWKRRSKSYQTLPMGQRVKLSFWMTAKATVDGVESLLSSLKNRSNV